MVELDYFVCNISYKKYKIYIIIVFNNYKLDISCFQKKTFFRLDILINSKQYQTIK